VPPGHPIDILPQPTQADQAHETPRDLVGMLHRLRDRYAEVGTSRDEEQNTVVEGAFLIGRRLEDDEDELHRLIRLPLFQQRPRPKRPWHKLKPQLLAVQFLLSPRTPNEGKRASWIARALQNLVGDNPEPGTIRAVLRDRGGLDGLARAQAKLREPRTDNGEHVTFTGKAEGDVGRALTTLSDGKLITIVAEHTLTKHGRHHRRLIGVKPADP
jgi:hypothetical protein